MTMQHIGTMLDEKLTWCGIPLIEGVTAFKDAETAAIAGKMNSEIYACEHCANAVVAALRNNY